MAVTLNYLNGGAGTIAPTAAQAAHINSLAVQVKASADADTTATIVHNWGLTAAQLAALQPWVLITPLAAAQAAALLSGWAAAWTDGNTITLTKATTASSGNTAYQIVVTLLKPHTIIQ